MNRLRHFLLFALLSAVGAARYPGAAQEVVAPDKLSCTIGPLNKTFGGTQWNVFGCNDDRSVAVISAAGNPAMPFYFFFVWGSGGLELHGEGTGSKEVTKAAFEALETLTEADVAALFRGAQSAILQNHIAAVGSWTDVAGGAWSPGEEMLAHIQADLPVFVKQQAAKLDKSLPDWSRYSFQYQGQSIDGRRFVFVSAFCIEPPEYVKERFLVVMDGGTCFFNVKYDPERRVFLELGFHGEA